MGAAEGCTVDAVATSQTVPPTFSHSPPSLVPKSTSTPSSYMDCIRNNIFIFGNSRKLRTVLSVHPYLLWMSSAAMRCGTRRFFFYTPSDFCINPPTFESKETSAPTPQVPGSGLPAPQAASRRREGRRDFFVATRSVTCHSSLITHHLKLSGVMAG
jgi:hypothetical protein